MLNRRLLMMGAAFGALAVRSGLAGKAIAGDWFAVTHTEEEWRKLLTPDQYVILRQAGTEHPFTSALLHEERKGNFACAGCDQDLFSSPPNSTAAPAGRASGRRLKMPSARPATRHSAWHVPPCTAAVAAVTSAMSSMTARSQPGFATA
ncbi:SelR domain family protein [Rhizobium leguminosarum]|uniref:peptide-methionine (R)-S-oxide reductase n=1 Tax=Rhizobium leguminosarum TaxID=384 RepID=A0A2Z4YFI7_RHILE|nr:SelR domain family protein [Rhizobium leguminosarum]